MPTLTHISRAPVLRKGSRVRPEPGDVIMGGQVLVGDADVDVPEIDDVAEVLGRAVVLLVCHGVVPSGQDNIKPTPSAASTAS